MGLLRVANIATCVLSEDGRTSRTAPTGRRLPLLLVFSVEEQADAGTKEEEEEGGTVELTATTAPLVSVHTPEAFQMNRHRCSSFIVTALTRSRRHPRRPRHVACLPPDHVVVR